MTTKAQAEPAAPPDTAPAEDSAAIKALKEKKAKIQLQSEIQALELTISTANANLKNKAALAAQKSLIDLLPTSENKGKEGTVTIAEDGGYFANILTALSIEDAAKEIAGKIDATKVLMVTGMDLQKLAGQYFAVDAQLATINPLLAELTQTTHEAATYVQEAVGEVDIAKRVVDHDEALESVVAATETALAAAPKILGAVADITKYFRTDTTIKPVTVTATDEMLNTALASALKSKGVSVIDPRFYLKLDASISTSYKSIVENTYMLRANTSAIEAEFDRYINQKLRKIDVLDAELAKQNVIAVADRTKRQKEDIASLALEKEQVEARKSYYESVKTSRLTDLKANMTAAETFSKALTTNDDDGVSPIAALKTYDFVNERIKDDETGLLNAKVAASGGEYNSRSGVFVSDKISYLGSVTVRYEIFNGTGDFLEGGLETRSMSTSTKYRNGYTDLKVKTVNIVPITETAKGLLGFLKSLW